MYGPSPEHEGIKKSVTETVEMIRRLPEAQLMRNCVWPFCVTASMAEGNREDWEYMIKILGREGRMGTLGRAWEVVQECWRLRREGTGKAVGWEDAMASLEWDILLI